MKYIVMLGDGMADLPLDELGGKTPLQLAQKPHMDVLAQKGLCGMVRTVPEGMNPGSDTANLSVLGYDPNLYYTGRSPLEAVSMGIQLESNDVAYRCNLVTLSDTQTYQDAHMLDYSADEITTSEAAQLIRAANEAFHSQSVTLYPGISYRHCLVLKDSPTGAQLTPPHDISNQPIRDHLPRGTNGKLLLDMMQRSRALFKNHPVNEKRIQRGLAPASSVWFWGEGRKPSLPAFEEMFGLQGAVISAVDLIKGIALCANMRSIDVPGATGNIHTNFSGKAQAALHALEQGADFVYVHVEAPDECGHRGETQNKIRSIELIDEKILGPLMRQMDEKGWDYNILLLPDHPTPLSLRTHTGDPVPFALYRSGRRQNGGAAYDEQSAEHTGVFVESGPALLQRFLNKQPV
ncbi:MAG: cofactor-independent phosphoglycerate mutase [Christensenellales bacterium]|jgi:2,3-bisphosphoglycerate-independent phosphoglycerate mutase